MYKKSLAISELESVRSSIQKSYAHQGLLTQDEIIRIREVFQDPRTAILGVKMANGKGKNPKSAKRTQPSGSQLSIASSKSTDEEAMDSEPLQEHPTIPKALVPGTGEPSGCGTGLCGAGCDCDRCSTAPSASTQAPPSGEEEGSSSAKKQAPVESPSDENDFF